MNSVIESRQVAWLEVHDFVAPWLQIVGSWPTLGSPAWCRLTADDPAKIAALLDGSRHWALRLDSCQAARADASRSVSAALDNMTTASGIPLNWAKIARERLTLNAYYEARPWAKRIGGGHV